MLKKYSIRIKELVTEKRPEMLRKGFELTENEKSELSDFGITAKTWTKAIINEEQFNDLDVISRFADFLKVNIKDIVNG